MGYTFTLTLACDGAVSDHEDAVADRWAEAVNARLPRSSEGITFHPGDEGLEAFFKPGRALSKVESLLLEMSPRLVDALPGFRVTLTDDFGSEFYDSGPARVPRPTPPAPDMDPIDDVEDKPDADLVAFEGTWSGRRDGPHLAAIDAHGQPLRLTFADPDGPVTVLCLFEARAGVGGSSCDASELVTRVVEPAEQATPVSIPIPEFAQTAELSVEWRGTVIPDQLFSFPVVPRTAVGDPTGPAR
jgi:hypothetical protein